MFNVKGIKQCISVLCPPPKKMVMIIYNNSLFGSNSSFNVMKVCTFIVEVSPFKPPAIDIQLIDHSSLTSDQKTPPPKHAKTPGHHDPSKKTQHINSATKKQPYGSPEVPVTRCHQAFLVAVYVLLTDLPSKHLVAKSSLLEHTLLCLQRCAGSLLLMVVVSCGVSGLFCPRGRKQKAVSLVFVAHPWFFCGKSSIF